MEIHLPGGLNVGTYAGAPDLADDLHEAEILLPSETWFLVRNAGHTDNYGYIEMEVLT